ncbi:MAG: cobalt-precorrin-4/precorrin-4 C(11)-methyltransferase, partial [Nitrospirota bacterium]
MMKQGRVYFIGVGPGDPELITIKGKRIIEEADIVIYAGSLINPDILKYSKKGASLYNSASMNLKEIISIIEIGAKNGSDIARLHSGDPAIYGAIQEQIDELNKKGIAFEIIPGVSSFLASASVLKNELTIPDIVQSVIITRVNKRTSSPSGERLSEFARHGATLVIFLSIQLIEEVERELLSVCPPDT